MNCFFILFYPQLVRVQIHENNSEEQPRKGALANEGTCHLHTEPHIIQAIKPVQKLSTKIEIKNRTLVFPETRSDESSGKLCLQNFSVLLNELLYNSFSVMKIDSAYITLV